MRLSHSGSYYYGRLFELLHEPHSAHLGKALALSRSEEHTPNVFENTEAIHRCLIASASSVRAYAADPSSVHRVATSFTPSGQWPDQPGDLEPPALRRRRRVAFLATLPSSQNSSGPEASLPGLFFASGLRNSSSGAFYNPFMLDELQFRNNADLAFASLKKSLYDAEDSADIEVEDQAGALNISFEDGTRFVVSPNAPVRQIWISALTTSFKLDWSEDRSDFILPKTGEGLKPLIGRLINQQLGEELVNLE
jgi:iron donor protein CyaY